MEWMQCSEDEEIERTHLIVPTPQRWEQMYLEDPVHLKKNLKEAEGEARRVHRILTGKCEHAQPRCMPIWIDTD